jgi:hypothetical protein
MQVTVTFTSLIYKVYFNWEYRVGLGGRGHVAKLAGWLSRSD